MTDRLACLLNREHCGVFISIILAKKLDSLKKKIYHHILGIEA